jgi:Fe-S-cluster-containing dehydrogenase component
VTECDRRKFLKLAGIAGMCGAPVKLFGAAGERLAGAAAAQKRLAMVVDLRKCREKSDCTACIAACHRAHNVPEFGDTKDQVKWVWKDSFENAFPEQAHEFQGSALKTGPVLLLCNHCDSPPCVSVCPTQATWKREKDGVVMMDWHRCIGCRYCMAACPYGSRSFNWRDPRPFIKEVTTEFPTRTRGVVEKCNFCEERLIKGERPACVQACPAKAMVFGDLRDPNAEVRQLLQSGYSIRRKPALGTQPQVFYIV